MLSKLFKPKLLSYYSYRYKFTNPMLEIEENQTIPGFFKKGDRKHQAFWYVDMRDVYAIIGSQNNETNAKVVTLCAADWKYEFQCNSVEDMQQVYNAMKLFWKKTQLIIELKETEVN